MTSDVVLLVNEDHGEPARLAAAIDLVRMLDAHLTCVDVVPTPDLMAPGGTRWAASLSTDLDAVIERRHADSIRSHLVAAGLECAWREMRGEVADKLAEASRLCDFVIINTRLRDIDAPDMAAIACRLTTMLGAAVIAVPEDLVRFDVSGDALILWDGSHDAQDALAAAKPLLRKAGRVSIIHADDGSLGEPLERATSYLRHHGITAEHRRLNIADAEVADAIEHYVQRHRPAFVVMGAFGRGLLRERLFGGVTQRLLATGRAPLLLARAK